MNRPFDVSRTLQEALLAVPDEIDGIEFSYLYRSATQGALIGGDFYDLFELGDNKVAVMIGDVSGKGLEAATLSTFVRDTLMTRALNGASPADAMQTANDLLLKISPETLFVTGFFGLLEIGTGRLTYCCAGHPPAILQDRRRQEAEVLDGCNIVLGAFDFVSFENATVDLASEDHAFVLYTDGVTDVRRDTELFGETRLVDLIGSSTAFKVMELPEKIFKAILKFGEGRLPDDIAILAISRTKKAE